MVDMAKMKKARTRDGREERKAVCDPSDLIGYEGRPSPETIGIAHQGIEHVTDKAALVIVHGSKIWVPKSQIVDADEENLVVTSWWADKNDVNPDW
jgi:hypothetical protein